MKGRRHRDAEMVSGSERTGRTLTPRLIVWLYVTFGAAWIVFSDRLLSVFIREPSQRDRMQSLKGALFVVTTAVLLYALIRKMQDERRAADAQVRTVLDSMADAVLVVDRAGDVVDANRAACVLWGARRVDELRMPTAAFVKRFDVRHADGRPLPVAESASLRALRGGPVRSEIRTRRLDGAELVLAVTSSPVRPAGGPADLAVTVLRDVTSMRRFEEMREEFLATAAHEFKTPLAVVKAYAQLMRRRGQGDAAALDVIGRQIDRLTRMVQQLLEVSRFRIGGAELRRERFDLAALVAEVVDSMRSQLDGRHVLVEAAPSGAAVVGDRERIGQVVANLLENAVRFSPEGGEVEAALQLRADEVVVSVRDHGVGIPVDRQDRVFERYYRAHAGTAEDYGGLGVGLDVSREIVARHGGRIWFESAPGAGSTFSFSLPLAPQDSTS